MKDRSHIMDDSLEKGGRDRVVEGEDTSECVFSAETFSSSQWGKSPVYSRVECVKHMEKLDFAELISHFKTEFPKYQEKSTSVIFLENCYLMARARKAKYYHEVFGYDIVCSMVSLPY